ncbi:MAG: phosphoribosylanthranilate isomerase [Halanaerobiales bacterium]
MQIKICGMTSKEDVMFCSKMGVNALGFILASSPRQITLKKVMEITQDIPPFIARVAVVVNSEVEELKKIESCGLFDYIQFHGDESPQIIRDCKLRTIKAISVSSKEDLKDIEKYKDADYYLFDTKVGSQVGGTGQSFKWSILDKVKINKPFILAGGLGPDNVEAALSSLPELAGVDLNSKLELAPGIKDHSLVKKGISVIKSYEFE